MKIPLVDLTKQYHQIREEVLSAVEKVMNRSSFILGDTVADFENHFADYCGASWAVGVSSGTAALHLALLSCDIGEGDEVITVPNTFIATAEAIAHTGARTVLVDVDPKTLNIDVEELDRTITEKTRAIIPVHLFGNPADIGSILDIVGDSGIRIIEDAAQAHGALCNGKKAGAIGDVGCFSFYPGKNLGAYGDAGAIITGDEEVASRVRMLRDHGRTEKFDHRTIGYNSRLDGLQAAVLLVKLKYLDEWNASRRHIAELYIRCLRDIHGIVPVEPLTGTTPVYHLFVVRIDVGSRDDLKAFLSSKGIMAGTHYPIPLHLTPAFHHLGYQRGDFPVSEKAASRILSLPIFPEMTDDQVHYIVDAISEWSCRNTS